MKKCILLLAAICGIWSAHAQSGLIAHWDMDDSVNDASGNGHNGMAHNITPAAGRDGVMGHAYYFNGVNSYIYVPYTPSLTMTTGFSIAAKVKVMGFYSGTCHANIIVDKGQLSYLGDGTYALYFTDGTAGIDCSAPVDSAQECFLGGACASGAGLGPSSITESNYTPHIVKNYWYDLVVTFNDTVYKMYVNDTLVNTTVITTPGVHMGAGTDGLSIGYDTYDSIGGYPYAFNGVIDDIKIFNRALDSSEVHVYTTAVKEVSKEDNINLYPNPANNKLIIENAANSVVSIYNAIGQRVQEQSITTQHQTLQIEQLVNGVYVVQFVAQDGSRISKPFIKE